MNRIGIGLITASLLALAGCSTPADAGTVASPVPSVSPSSAAAAPTAEPHAAPLAEGRSDAPVEFGRSVTTPEGLVISFAEVDGRRPGDPPTPGDAATRYASTMSRESVILRVGIHNGSSAVVPLEGLRFLYGRNGRPADLLMVDRNLGDAAQGRFIRVGGDYEITVVVPGSASDDWTVVVRGTDMSTGEKVDLAAATSQAARSDMSAELRVPPHLPTGPGDGVPAYE